VHQARLTRQDGRQCARKGSLGPCQQIPNRAVVPRMRPWPSSGWWDFRTRTSCRGLLVGAVGLRSRLCHRDRLVLIKSRKLELKSVPSPIAAAYTASVSSPWHSVHCNRRVIPQSYLRWDRRESSFHLSSVF